MILGSNILVYLFIFFAIYFESFLLVTFLSKPAHEQRKRVASKNTPKVAIIVPCWNETTTISGTVNSLLALDYPSDRLSIILVNDGSTDTTPQTMELFSNNPQVTIIHKENGGKHTALNAGIAAAPQAELIGCLDADSFVERDALREIVACFTRPQVMAATASILVHKPKTLMQRMQYAEYVLGVAVRHMLSSVNGIYVTPGPFSLYRSSIFKELGGFIHAHQTEDMEMALRTQRAGYEIENAIHARVYTKVPATLPKLLAQRTRWLSGLLRNVLYDYRTLIANPRHGALGMLVLPFILLSVVGSIVMLTISITLLSQNLIHGLFIINGIPLSYILAFHQISWFYLPITTVMLLGGILLVTTISFMFVGKNISRASGTLTPNILVYVLLYSFVSPLWLVRSIVDVTRGTHRSWR